MAYMRSDVRYINNLLGGLKLRNKEFILPVQRDTTLVRKIISAGSSDSHKFNYSRTFTTHKASRSKAQLFKGLSGIEFIREIKNPFLYAAYLLKKRQKGSGTTERTVFHGTRTENIESICENNLNYRLRGKYGHLGNRYGNGVSFSRTINYAKQFPRRVSGLRAMFIVQVMETGCCVGRQGLRIPKKGCDTTVSPNRAVLVKYSDNEFYPTHVAYYSR